MSALALPWFVLVTTGSPERMSFVVAAELIGLGLLGLPGGKLLRRLGARRTMLLCDGLRGPLMALIPVLYWNGALTLGGLLAASFALGALTTPYFSAQKVIVPELLGEDESVVSRASALFQAAQRVTLLLGPVAAGVLISVISAPGVLLVDAATYGAALLLVALFVPRRPPLTEDEPSGIPQGFRFLVREPLLRAWMPLFAIGDTAWTAFFLSVPVLVVARFGSDAKIAGWLLASFGVGALIGNAIAYRALLDRVRGLSVVAAFVLVQAVPLWLLIPRFPAFVYSAALVTSGLGNGLVNPSIHALMTLRIPPALRPSAMTVMALLYGLLNPVGVFVTGPVLGTFGTRPVFVAFAALQTVCMTGVALASLRVRSAEAPAVPAAEMT
jgi:MFS family permease